MGCSSSQDGVQPGRSCDTANVHEEEGQQCQLPGHDTSAGSRENGAGSQALETPQMQQSSLKDQGAVGDIEGQADAHPGPATTGKAAGDTTTTALDTTHTCSEGDVAAPSNLAALQTTDGQESWRWQERSDEVIALMRAAKLFDAYAAMTALQQDVNEELSRLSKLDEQTDRHLLDTLRNLAERLKTEPIFQKLRQALVPLQEGLQVLRQVNVKQVRPDDKRWIRVELQEPRISEDFRILVLLRHAEEEERHKNGPNIQFFCIFQLFNMPLTLQKETAKDLFMDMSKKDWIKDCNILEAQMDPEAIWRCAYYFKVSPPIAPLSVDEMRTRHTSVIPQSVLPSFGPGSMTVDTSPPYNVTSFEGWTVPDPARGVLRIRSFLTWYREASAEFGSDYEDLTVVNRISAPAPWFLAPLALQLLKHIMCDVVLTMVMKVKEGFIEKFDELGYADRMAQFPELFEALGRACVA